MKYTKIRAGIEFLETDIYAIQYQLKTEALDCAAFLMVQAYLRMVAA